MTVRCLPRLLRPEEARPPEPAASIDITASAPMREERRTFFIAPRDATRLRAGDHAFVLGAAEQLAAVAAVCNAPRSARRVQWG